MQHPEHRLRLRRRNLRNQQHIRLLALALLTATTLAADPQLPRELEGVGVSEKLGQQVDLNLQFVAEDGYAKPLSSYFNQGKPVILNLVYYTCPMLCGLILNGQTSMLRELSWTPGSEFEIVTISIDPREHFDLARKKKAVMLSSYERPAPGWHFLTDHNDNAKKLAAQVGFNYRFDEQQQQYAHAAAIMILTPEGRVSRYLYGARYKERDVRLALTEASQGKLGTTVDRMLLFCFQYDPKVNSYVLFAKNIMRVGGGLTVLLMGLVLMRLWRRDRIVSTEKLVNAR